MGRREQNFENHVLDAGLSFWIQYWHPLRQRMGFDVSVIIISKTQKNKTLYNHQNEDKCT